MVMRCGKKLKACVGYTQNDEWCVVMFPFEEILCECHRPTGFYLKCPFSIEKWEEEWKQCEKKLFRGNNIEIEWEILNTFVLLDNKTTKTILGTLKK